MMITANKILEDSLRKLVAKVTELANSDPSELEPIRDVVSRIFGDGMKPSAFVQNLQELAGAVINVRKGAAALSPLKTLPVPPYDLWLPFAVHNSSPVNEDTLAEASQIFKNAVSDLDRALRLQPDAPPKLEDPTTICNQIFISYAREDERFLRGLLAKMDVYLKNRVGIGCSEWDVWHDAKIKPGDEWLEKINLAIAQAKFAILLVSDDFLNSKFVIEHELPQLLQREEKGDLKLLWISVRPHPHEETRVSKYQCLNIPEKPLAQFEGATQEQELLEICKKIFKLVDASSSSGNPQSRRLVSQVGQG